MSRLDELIKELCPDGVEYKSIPELFDTKNGYTPSKSNNEFWENGTIPWFRMEDIREHGHILSEATQYVSEKAIKGKPFPADSIIVATSATIGEHALIKVPSLANQRFTYLIVKKDYAEKLNIKYVYYYCFKLDEYCKTCLKQGNFASVDMKRFAKFKFPVPPLEVQNEIVRILDNFTELTDELTAKLTAELTARQKQYEFYRDKLLDFGVLGGGTSECVWKTLGDVCDVVAGGTPSKKNVGYWEKGTIKWLGSTVCQNQKNIENITGYITEKGLAESSTKLMKKGTTLIALVGATIGKRAFLPFEAAINQNIAGIYPKNTHELNPSYVYYACALLYPKFLALTQGSKLAMANISFVRSLEIPVPSVRIQNRIVHVLDNFDAICSDLNIGLPAEIEARQKQYEYYRDMLLTFAESGNTISRAEQSRAL